MSLISIIPLTANLMYFSYSLISFSSICIIFHGMRAQPARKEGVSIERGIRWAILDNLRVWHAKEKLDFNTDRRVGLDCPS
jgi:hypothetical protein